MAQILCETLNKALLFSLLLCGKLTAKTREPNVSISIKLKELKQEQYDEYAFLRGKIWLACDLWQGKEVVARRSLFLALTSSLLRNKGKDSGYSKDIFDLVLYRMVTQTFDRELFSIDKLEIDTCAETEIEAIVEKLWFAIKTELENPDKDAWRQSGPGPYIETSTGFRLS